MTQNQLFHEHKNVAYHLSRRFWAPGYDREDIDQIALLALWKAVLKFDPKRHKRFFSFAYPTIKNELCNEFRKTRIEPDQLEDWHMWGRGALDPEYEKVVVRNSLIGLDRDHQIVLLAKMRQQRSLSRDAGMHDKRFHEITKSLRDNLDIQEFLNA